MNFVSQFALSPVSNNEYKTRRAVQVLTEKEASDEDNKSFPACLAWEPGWFWVYSFVTQKCKIETPDKGPHES